jgi:hypothetical protein
MSLVGDTEWIFSIRKEYNTRVSNQEKTTSGNDYSQRYEITPTSLITANLILFLACKTAP